MWILRRPVLVLFIVVVATVYCLALYFAARDVHGWLSGRSKPPSPAGRALRMAVYCLASLGLACGTYSYFVEPYRLAVTRVRLSTTKLPAGTKPIRLVHISDLHCDPKARLEPQLPERIAELHPDVIVFTGDAINSQGGLANFRRCMRQLASIASTYAVEGNWDVVYFPGVDLYGGTGVRLLKNEAVQLDGHDGRVWLVGMRPGSKQPLERLLNPVAEGAFVVFLYHYPDLIYELAQRGVDLCCAGHTHGGQVALPFYGALVTLSKFGKRFEAGLYRVEDTWMYVSRGVGMEGGWAPRVRFCARPEVTLIEIAPQGELDAGCDRP